MNNRLLPLLLLATLICTANAGFGRAGMALRSAGNNLDWNNASTWIIVQTGQTGQVIPQSNDTIYIEHEISLNLDFVLSAGRMVIENTGTLESVNSVLTLAQGASANCYGHISCKNLLVLDQSSFKLAPGGSITVNSDLQVADQATFIVENNQGNCGSLITHGTVQGQILMQYVVPANVNRLVSAPVMGAESGVFLNMYLRNYSESNSGWGDFIVPTTIPLNPMQGYEVQSLYDDERAFTGIPNTGEQRIDITATGDGWNLIGNPYPSAINWSLLGSGNDAGVYPESINTIYYLDDNGSGNYSVYCPGDEPITINHGSPVIKPMQGFFVKADHGSNISVTNAMRLHSTGTKPEAELPFTALRLRIEGNNYSDEAVLRFNPDATDYFDVAYDAYELPGIETAPGIFFSLDDGNKLALNTLGDISSGLVVPVQVITPYQGTSALIVQGTSVFQYRYPVFLEDMSNGLFIDLRSDSVYYFESGNGSSSHFFRLHFSSPGGINESEPSTISVIAGESAILIHDAEGSKGSIDVFSVDGRLQLSKEYSSLQDVKIPVSPDRVYIVRINTGDKIVTRKLFCR